MSASTSIWKVPLDPCPSVASPEITQWLSFLYGSGAFQAAPYVMGFGVSEFLHESFKSGVFCLSHSP